MTAEVEQTRLLGLYIRGEELGDEVLFFLPLIDEYSLIRVDILLMIAIELVN
jgi:hypothetical protein